jgi:hypothetical protein
LETTITGRSSTNPRLRQKGQAAGGNGTQRQPALLFGGQTDALDGIARLGAEQLK